MSKPRHHPRTASQVKLRLRLPTDGSVDLDKLRAALEARLEKPPAPEPEVKVVPVPARPKVAPLPKPQPEPRPKSSGVWQWINNNAPTAVSIFSAVLAFFFGLIYIGQKSTGGSVWPLLGWVFFASIGFFAISFAVVVFRQLKLEDSAASKHWAEIKENPKKAYVPALIFAGVTVAVLFGLALFQSPPTEVAQGKDKSKTETPVKPTKDPTGEPKSPLVIPPTPPSKTKEIDTPKPTVPEAIPLKPAEGYVGRLGTVCGVFGLMGLGLFKLNRMKKARFPDAEALTAGAKNEYIEFARGFRTFIAVQGGGLLVAAAVGAMILVWDTTRWDSFEVEGQPGVILTYSVWSFILWMIMGMALAAPMVMALGAAGLDLMPTLDRKFNPSKAGSAVKRFLQRKLWHIVLSGLVFGAFVSVIKVEPVQYWLHLWLKWSLIFGLIPGYLWVRNTGKVISVKRPSAPKSFSISSLFIFNLPLLTLLAAVLAIMVALMTGINWLHLWWVTPLMLLAATILVGVMKSFPGLLMNWWWFVIIAAVIAGLCDIGLHSYAGAFWIVFALAFAGWGYSEKMLRKSIRDQEWQSNSLSVLRFPKKKEDYRPVIHPDRNGVQIRWGSLAGVVTVVILLLASSGFFVWNGL